jgi:hypothetical protein
MQIGEQTKQVIYMMFAHRHCLVAERHLFALLQTTRYITSLDNTKCCTHQHYNSQMVF